MRLLPVFSLLLGCFLSACAPVSPGELVVTARWGGVNWIMPSTAQLIDSTGDETIYGFADTTHLLHVVATISNPTDDTLTFMSMTCSYEVFFDVDDTVNFAVIVHNACYSNGPCSITLPPHTSTDRMILIRWKHPQRGYPSRPIRIGMDQGTHVLWSNELYFDRLEKANYPIE